MSGPRCSVPSATGALLDRLTQRSYPGRTASYRQPEPKTAETPKNLTKPMVDPVGPQDRVTQATRSSAGPSYYRDNRQRWAESHQAVHFCGVLLLRALLGNSPDLRVRIGEQQRGEHTFIWQNHVNVPCTKPDRKRKERKARDYKDLERKGANSPISRFRTNKKARNTLFWLRG